MTHKKSRKRIFKLVNGLTFINPFRKIFRKVHLYILIILQKKSPKIRFGSKLWISLAILGGLFFVFFQKGLFVAALVGKRPIFRLSLLRELEKVGGKETLESLITKELILQEAQKRNITISDQQIDAEIKVLREKISSQGLSLDDILASQNQTKENLIENIKIQLFVEELLKEKIQISEEDLENYFELNKNLYPPEIKIDDVKDDLKEKLRQQKLATEFQNWINELRNQTQVKYFVNF